MLTSLHLDNFTVFPNAQFTFGKNLNILMGENGAGKSHILKAAYAALAAITAKGRDSASVVPTKSQLQISLANKLQAVFRPDGLWRLICRKTGRSNCRLSYTFDLEKLNLSFTCSSVTRTEVALEISPTMRSDQLPVFLPTRELLSIYPGFASLYDTAHLHFEETWRDTCILLGAPLIKSPPEAGSHERLAILEEAMGGKVELDKLGRFYLNSGSDKMEMHLVAEGLRKLATVARLMANGSLLGKGYLFWDEPDSGLSPRFIQTVAQTILLIAGSGLQVFIATHSLVLLRELRRLQQTAASALDSQCFGLRVEPDQTVTVQQGGTIDDVGGLSALGII